MEIFGVMANCVAEEILLVGIHAFNLISKPIQQPQELPLNPEAIS